MMPNWHILAQKLLIAQTANKFISDMKKLFAVCAISNFGAEICQFGIMDDFSKRLFGDHINILCTMSPDVTLPFSFTSFHFNIFEHVTDTFVPW